MLNSRDAIAIGARLAACWARPCRCCLVAGQAQAAPTSIPPGAAPSPAALRAGKSTEASCNVPVLCTAEAATTGPTATRRARSRRTRRSRSTCVALFKSTVTLQSPDFTVADGGDGDAAPGPAVRLRRAGRPGAAVHLHGRPDRPHRGNEIEAADRDDRRRHPASPAKTHAVDASSRPHLRDLDRRPKPARPWPAPACSAAPPAPASTTSR